jgi:helix-turn-helix protein
VCDLHAEYRLYAMEVEQVERARREGKGKRPSAQVVRQVQKRKSITYMLYTRNRDKLEARLAELRPKPTLAEMIAGGKL